MISSIPNLLETAAIRDPDKLFISEPGRHITFLEFETTALASAAALRHMGIRKGDRVGVCMAKSIDQALAIVSILLADAVCVPILPKLKHDNIAHIVNDSGMTALVVDPPRLSEVETIAAESDVCLVLGTDTNEETDLARLPYLRQHITATDNAFSCIGADNAAIIYSSGSTGRPKGIVISHRNLFDGARIVSSYLGTSREDRIAGNLTFNFDYGLNQIWQCLLTGASLHLHEFIFPNDFFRFLADERITAIPLMPVFISRMFDRRFADDEVKLDFSAVRYICTTGGRVSEHMIKDLRATFPDAEVYLMYGLTEAFRSSYLPPDQLAVRPGSMGKAIPDVELYVLDENGEDCPPETPGELVHRGGCVAKGYWNDPARTAERFRQIARFPGETLVFSGDAVRKDADGYLYFIGRKDEMIKTHGYRVSPSEIEEIANRFAGVSASAAFGIQNIDIGEDIALAYTVRTEPRVDETAFRQHLKRTLPSHMAPRHLVRFDSFPSTGNDGKIDRQHTRESLLKQLAGTGSDATKQGSS
jgi:amino acid adenylation domain-containing protein